VDGLEKYPQTEHEAVGRRIGHALRKYPAAAIIQATMHHDAAGRACDLENGPYLLRTN